MDDAPEQANPQERTAGVPPEAARMAKGTCEMEPVRMVECTAAKITAFRRL